MESQIEELEKKYREFVVEGFKKNQRLCNPLYTQDEYDHVINIGVSIIMAKNKIKPGGSFVSAIVDGDLHAACSRADLTMLKCIPFMSWVYQNSHYA